MNKKTFFAPCFFVLSLCSAPAADFEIATNAVKNMGVGWNLGNTLDANGQKVTDISNSGYWGQQGLDSETYWGQPVTKPELLKMMKDAGFGAIRVPVTWYNHMDEDGKVNAAWMQRVHEVVDYVINQGMYCILNVHHDTGADSYDNSGKLTGYHWVKADESNFETNKARFEDLWKQIGEEFKNYDQHLLFESYNEMLDTYNSWCFASFASPNKYDAKVASSAYNAINSYAQSFVTTVRATGGNNAQRNLVVNTYGCCSGGGTWNSHLKDPLKEMKLPDDPAGPGRIIFQIHAYPSLVNDNGSNRLISDIESEIDDMINGWNTHLVSKGAPVILGEWGTSNVDGAVTDYEARRELMFAFCEYLVKQCKANDIGTFYWMGLTDGMARFFPAFSQPDLARTILQAYYGSSFNPVLPDSKNYSISCTVDYTQQWGELNLYNGSGITSADYISLILELDETPASGLLQLKMYSSKYPNGSYKTVTSAATTWAFTAAMGSITRVTLQCNQTSGRARVKSVKLKKRSGEEVLCTPSVAWNCTMSDIAVTVGINNVRHDFLSDDRIYNLQGQRILNPSQGLFIKNGKKFIVR